MVVDEIFCSLQGEGPTLGRPAVFLRTVGCNLMCQWCDTPTWPRLAGTQVLQSLLGYATTNRMLVVTGGEPLMQEEGIIEILSKKLFGRVEIETNGTIFPCNRLIKRVTCFNVSPKPSFAEAGNGRLNLDVVTKFRLLAHKNKAIFKFVVRNRKDVEEIEDEFIVPAGIPNRYVWLMPCGKTREELAAVYPEVAALALASEYNFSPRLHIDLWNGKRGT